MVGGEDYVINVQKNIFRYLKKIHYIYVLISKIMRLSYEQIYKKIKSKFVIKSNTDDVFYSKEYGYLTTKEYATSYRSKLIATLISKLLGKSTVKNLKN